MQEHRLGSFGHCSGNSGHLGGLGTYQIVTEDGPYHIFMLDRWHNVDRQVKVYNLLEAEQAQGRAQGAFGDLRSLASYSK